ncbi:MAG TPA: hypothetical protein VFP93_03430 [Gammaproteobacteria bacterium]|nr:hypothetical protein [Gammaproteobacteria bacterium]
MKYLVVLLSLFPLQVAYSNCPQVCKGTEPFWNAEISEKSLTFQKIDEESQTYTLENVQHALGLQDDFLTKYQLRQEGAVKGTIFLLKTGNCSDGMSDEIFPYSVILDRDNDASLHYGCCK